MFSWIYAYIAYNSVTTLATFYLTLPYFMHNYIPVEEQIHIFFPGLHFVDIIHLKNIYTKNLG